MDSGIQVNEEAIRMLDTFKEVAKSTHKWCILEIQPKEGAVGTKSKLAEEEVAVVECPEGTAGYTISEAEWNQLVQEKFKPDQPLIVIFYLEYTKPDQGVQKKLGAVNWVPDTAPMKLKMRYSSTFKAVCTKAPKLNFKLEAHDDDEVEYSVIVDKVKK